MAQADAPVARPEIKVGDRWTYRRFNYDTGRILSTDEMRVVFSVRGVVQVVSTDSAREGETDTTYTSEWNAVTVQSRVFNPHTGWLSFPLQIGKTWKSGFDTVMPGKKISSRNERLVKVIGWEDVVVPAGKFRALKVISDGTFQRHDTAMQGSSRNVLWYVPETRRWVKLTLENRPKGGQGYGEYTGEELVDYKLQ
jgi:hypothetical protein